MQHTGRAETGLEGRCPRDVLGGFGEPKEAGGACILQGTAMPAQLRGRGRPPSDPQPCAGDIG